MKHEMNKLCIQNYIELSQYFTDKTSFFISSARKTENL